MANTNHSAAHSTVERFPTPNIAPDAERPLDVISDRLNQAHATLDLLFTVATAGGTSGGQSVRHLENLCVRSLEYAIHGAMLRISESLKALEAVRK